MAEAQSHLACSFDIPFSNTVQVNLAFSKFTNKIPSGTSGEIAGPSFLSFDMVILDNIQILRQIRRIFGSNDVQVKVTEHLLQ